MTIREREAVELRAESQTLELVVADDKVEDRGKLPNALQRRIEGSTINILAFDTATSRDTIEILMERLNKRR